MVFPAHDYKGETVSTIGEEKAFNPRLQVKSIDEYVELMSNLNLPNPKMMDVAVPANMRVGLAQEAIAQRGWAVSAAEAIRLARPAGRGAGRSARAERAREARRHPRLAARPLPRPRGQCAPRRHAARARRAPPASASCSTAPSASARRWRCRPRRTPALPRPATSRAASTPGRKRAGRWCADASPKPPVIARSGSGTAWCARAAGGSKNGSGSFTSMIWPASMNTMRLATWRAKPISWLTTSMVMPSIGERRPWCRAPP